MRSYTTYISSLFAACNELRRCFNALERQAEMVQEISMNASVTAAQTGSHMRICSEIAAQIALTGRRMQKQVEAVRAEVNQITNLVLSALVQEGRLRKYQEALASVARPSNRALLQRTIEQYLADTYENAERIQRHVHQTTATLHGLEQCQSRLFAALSAFEIESIDLSGSEFQAIAALVESLNATTEAGTQQIEGIATVLGSIKRLTHAVQDMSHKELIRAKIRAA